MDGRPEAAEGQRHASGAAARANNRSASVQANPAAQAASPLLDNSPKGRRSEVSDGSGGKGWAGRRHSTLRSNRSGKALFARKQNELLTAVAVPKG